ncbi:MAG: HmuY family protein [Bacteroidota bacterium]
MRKLITLLSLVVLFSSCFKEDEIVTPHDPGDAKTAIIPMTRYYSNQVYFSLEKEDIVSINNRSIFDLNFNCNDTTAVVRLNTANFALAAETIFDRLEDVTDTTGLTWKFDVSDGNPDSLAIHSWMSIIDGDTTFNNKVWVINRGLNSLGISLGIKKIQFTGFRSNTYYFTYSNLDNSEMVEGFALKDNKYSYMQYSFDDESVVQIEPEIQNWDLLFTTYTTMLTTSEGELYPYLLTGTLQNQSITSVALDTVMQFANIVLADTVSFDFSNALDKIGYDWKKLIGDVNTGNVYYEINMNYNYIIKDGKSYFYKLRFINFYEPTTGEKGYPTFEYVRL